MYHIKVKRIYEAPAPEDGYRILVDRLWPRGVSKGKAKLDEWDKEIAPSHELRKWFDHKEERFQAFSERYKQELSEKTEYLERLVKMARQSNLTFLYAAKNETFNQAEVLKEVLMSY